MNLYKDKEKSNMRLYDVLHKSTDMVPFCQPSSCLSQGPLPASLAGWPSWQPQHMQQQHHPVLWSFHRMHLQYGESKRNKRHDKLIKINSWQLCGTPKITTATLQIFLPQHWSCSWECWVQRQQHSEQNPCLGRMNGVQTPHPQKAKQCRFESPCESGTGTRCPRYHPQ